MKFTCDQQTMYDVVSYISKYTTKVTSRMVEQMLYLSIDDNLVTLRSTSGIVYCSITFPVLAESAGEAALDGNLFSNILSTMSSGDVVISGSKRLTIKQDSKVRRVSTGIVEDFPLPPKVGSEVDINVNTDVFVRALSQVEFARSATMINPILRGFYLDFEALGMVVATDSQRMAYHTLASGIGEFSFPSEGMEALDRGLKLCSGEVTRLQTTPPGWIRLSATNGIIDVDIYIATVAGEYPIQILPLLNKLTNTPGYTKIHINKEDLIPSIKMAVVLSEVTGKASGAQALKISTTTEGSIVLEMSTSDGDMCDTLDCNVVGEPTMVQLFPPHVLQILQTAPEKDIEMRIWKHSHPVLFTCGEDWNVIQAPVGDKEAAEEWQQRRKEEYKTIYAEEEVEEPSYDEGYEEDFGGDF